MGSFRKSHTLGAGILLLACLAGLLWLPRWPLAPVALAAALWLAWADARRATLVYLGILPLVAAMPRGLLVPWLRPDEVLLFGLVLSLAGKAILGIYRPRLGRLDLWLLLFAATAVHTPLISLLRGTEFSWTWLVFAGGTAIMPWLIWRVIVQYLEAGGRVRTLLAVLGLAAVGTVVVSLLQATALPVVRRAILFVYPEPLEAWRVAKYGSYFASADRVTGPFAGGWNVLAMYCLVTALLLLGARALDGRPWGGWRGALLVAALSAVVVLTGSYTCMGAMALAYTGQALWLGRRREILWPALGVVAAVLVFFPLVEGRYQKQFGRGRTSLDVRLDQWEERVLPALLEPERLWLGLAPQQRSDYRITVEDNYYLYLLAIGGLPHFLVYVCLVVFLVRRLIPRARGRMTESARLWGIVGVTMLSGILLANFTGAYAKFSGTVETFWCVVALGLALGAAAEPPAG